MAEGQQHIAIASRLPVSEIAPGLSEPEVKDVQSRFSFAFPPDPRAMLVAGLPVGNRWPNWRAALAGEPAAKLEYARERLGWPLDGMLFDIRHNTFWDPQCGPRPAELSAAMAIATAAVRVAPVLIPI